MPIASVATPYDLLLDLTGVTRLFGGEGRLCGRILAFCRRTGLLPD